MCHCVRPCVRPQVEIKPMNRGIYRGTEITSKRNVMGTITTSEMNVQGTDITYERTDITCKRKVQGTDITSERNVQWMDITYERNIPRTDIKREMYRDILYKLMEQNGYNHY